MKLAKVMKCGPKCTSYSWVPHLKLAWCTTQGVGIRPKEVGQECGRFTNRTKEEKWEAEKARRKEDERFLKHFEKRGW